jgi:hypothetical protein
VNIVEPPKSTVLDMLRRHLLWKWDDEAYCKTCGRGNQSVARLEGDEWLKTARPETSEALTSFDDAFIRQSKSMLLTPAEMIDRNKLMVELHNQAVEAIGNGRTPPLRLNTPTELAQKNVDGEDADDSLFREPVKHPVVTESAKTLLSDWNKYFSLPQRTDYTSPMEPAFKIVHGETRDWAVRTDANWANFKVQPDGTVKNWDILHIRPIDYSKWSPELTRSAWPKVDGPEPNWFMDPDTAVVTKITNTDPSASQDVVDPNASTK